MTVSGLRRGRPAPPRGTLKTSMISSKTVESLTFPGVTTTAGAGHQHFQAASASTTRGGPTVGRGSGTATTSARAGANSGPPTPPSRAAPRASTRWTTGGRVRRRARGAPGRGVTASGGPPAPVNGWKKTPGPPLARPHQGPGNPGETSTPSRWPTPRTSRTATAGMVPIAAADPGPPDVAAARPPAIPGVRSTLEPLRGRLVTLTDRGRPRKLPDGRFTTRLGAACG